jgi:hypothetical protein
MEQLYFEMHRTHDIAAGALPLRPGPAAVSGASRFSPKGGNGGHVEMAECLISTRALEVISNRPAEKFRNPGNPGFSDFQGHLHAHATY